MGIQFINVGRIEMTIYYPITQEELSEYAKLKAESISADMASIKSVEEKAKKI